MEGVDGLVELLGVWRVLFAEFFNDPSSFQLLFAATHSGNSLSFLFQRPEQAG
jgi:hypothetical protein